MEKRFPREITALDEIFEFVSEFVAAGDLAAPEAFPLDLVVEELFTNFVRHNTGTSREIAIRLERHDDRVVVALTDFGVRGFDPTQAPIVDTNAPLEERQPGGLGIHFVRQIAESISYDHADGNTTITVTKRLES